MTYQTFKAMVEAHADLEGLGFNTQEIAIRHVPSGLVTVMPLAALHVMHEESLLRLLTGEDTMTDVVAMMPTGSYAYARMKPLTDENASEAQHAFEHARRR